MFGNFFAGLLLFSDFFTYVYDGVEGRTAFVMIRVANFVLFFTTFLIVITITMYVAVQLFGTAGVKVKIPGQNRLINNSDKFYGQHSIYQGYIT